MIELLVMVAALTSGPAPPDHAPPPEYVAPATAGAIGEAEQLMLANRFAEARAVLLALDAAPSGIRSSDNQVQFLLGMLDMQEQDFEGAVGRFRRILVTEPNTARVRLEMGRALFLGGRLDDAERQFMYARAGQVPGDVRANIDRFLIAIRQQKTFTYGFSFAIAPDSNVNAGPATDTVTLYGLPFELSPEAKANSGVGLTVAANAEWAPRVSAAASWRTGGQLYRVQHRQSEFDDMTLSVYTGPRLTMNRWDMNVIGSVARRWYGNDGYSTSFGPSIDVTHYINPRFGLGLSANLQPVRYDIGTERNGTAVAFGASFFYAPSSSSFLRGAVDEGRQGAQSAALGFGSRRVSLSYTRELGGGFTVGVAPSFTATRYAEPLAVFQRLRRDHHYSLQLTVLNRRLDFHGLTPRIAYTLNRNDSNIDLFTFARHRFEVGITSSF